VTVEHVEVLVEEQSMEAALGLLLPRLLGGISFCIHAHQGKQDLMAKLPGKLKAYGKWLRRGQRLVVVLDTDGESCEELKTMVEGMARAGGLRSRMRDPRGWNTVSRFAIEELEAWYFGDWQAVRMAYPRVPSTVPQKRAYRDPDRIEGGTWEAFQRELQAAGYFVGGLRKVEAASAVAAHMVPSRNVSPSFQRFVSAMEEIAGVR
jgi:hypothetical protein